MRYPPTIARYSMLSHKKQKENPNRWILTTFMHYTLNGFFSCHSFKKLEIGAKISGTDGLNSLDYKLLDVQKLPLYTWILADLKKWKHIMQKKVNKYQQRKLWNLKHLFISRKKITVEFLNFFKLRNHWVQ